jgi:hypothetical protein
MSETYKLLQSKYTPRILCISILTSMVGVGGITGFSEINYVTKTSKKRYFSIIP